MNKNLQTNLVNHLQQIVRKRDPYMAKEGHFFVREYIKQELSKFGQIELHKFDFYGVIYQNIILNLPSQEKSKNTAPILIGAHYDTVLNSPGADDNGTGIAVLLELARFFSINKAPFPIRLVAFDLEEYGLLGSRTYANFLKHKKEPLRLMISLEMLGYCDRRPNSQKYPPGLKYFYSSKGDFIALIGNIFTIPEMMKISSKIKENNINCQWLPAGFKGLILPDTRRSDHAPFWDNGYKAMMVTDTANLRNPHYHRDTDTLKTLDLDFLTDVCQGLMMAIMAIYNG